MLAPAVCEGCGEPLVRGERVLCTVCAASLTPACPAGDRSGQLRARLHPRTAPVRLVSAWAYYTHESVVGCLLRRAKYDDRPDIVRHLSGLYARELESSGVLGDVDVLLPVPMHPLKQMLRGYNQAAEMARVIGRRLDIPLGDNLRASRLRAAQAGRAGYSRHRGADGAFAVARADELRGLHVAVNDDIITTGATMSAAISALVPCGVRAISVLALAATVRE